MIQTKHLLLFVVMLFSLIACKTSSKKRHKYMQQAYIAYKDTFKDANVNLLHDSIFVIFPNNILFNSNESNILEQFMLKLDRMALVFNTYSKTNMLITGHADSTGQEQLNNKLSIDRAENVKLELMKRQVLESRLFTWGQGKRAPRTSNKTSIGRALNRRVEFVILYNSK